MTTTRTEKQKMDIRSIASAVREDIKAATKAGKLPKFKVSVRISRYSGGQSLRVDVVGVPAGYLAVNINHIEFFANNPHAGHWNCPEEARERLCAKAKADLAAIDAIVGEYHWDESDIQSDYFHCNFYKKVDFSHDLVRAQRDALEASFAAPVACKVVSVKAKVA